jgi:hypothetical protein
MGAELYHADVQTRMMQRIVVYRNIAKASKNDSITGTVRCTASYGYYTRSLRTNPL